MTDRAVFIMGVIICTLYIIFGPSTPDIQAPTPINQSMHY